MEDEPADHGQMEPGSEMDVRMNAVAAENRRTLDAKIAAVDAQMDTLNADYDAANDQGQDIFGKREFADRYDRLKEQKAAYEAQRAALH